MINSILKDTEKKRKIKKNYLMKWCVRLVTDKIERLLI